MSMFPREGGPRGCTRSVRCEGLSTPHPGKPLLMALFTPQSGRTRIDDLGLEPPLSGPPTATGMSISGLRRFRAERCPIHGSAGVSTCVPASPPPPSVVSRQVCGVSCPVPRRCRGLCPGRGRDTGRATKGLPPCPRAYVNLRAPTWTPTRLLPAALRTRRVEHNTLPNRPILLQPETSVVVVAIGSTSA